MYLPTNRTEASLESRWGKDPDIGQGAQAQPIQPEHQIVRQGQPVDREHPEDRTGGIRGDRIGRTGSRHAGRRPAGEPGRTEANTRPQNPG